MATSVIYLCLLFPGAERWLLPYPGTSQHWSALMGIAQRWELAQPEPRAWPSTLREEIAWVRRRLVEARGYPPLADLDRLPSHRELMVRRDFLCSLRRYVWIQANLCSWHRGECLMVDEGVSRWEKATTLMLAARSEYSPTFVYWINQRKALNELRDLIGPDSYYAGQW